MDQIDSSEVTLLARPPATVQHEVPTSGSRDCALTAELKSVDSAACLRCWPIGDNGSEGTEFVVGTAFVVNLRCSVLLGSYVVEEKGDV